MDAIPISKTKIIPPRRREELLSRKRLLNMLFDALDKKLLLISAPAGYGKTSLLIDLAHQGELPFCWLALDEMDRDPQRFIAYFIAAIAERFPNFGQQSMVVLNGLTSIEQDMERMLVTMVNEAYEQIHEHFILALDDFHIVDDVEPIQSFLNRFVQLVDENCHLIVSSRMLAGLPDLPLLVARENVSGLDFSDLAFHVSEIQALFEQNYNHRLSDAEAHKLIEETEGWITGLQFSDFKPPRGSQALSGTIAGIGLFEYLGQQVLDRQTAEVRDFLLRSSLLEEFDAALCEAVLGPFYPETRDWQGWIGMIVRNNLFTLPVGADGTSLRYHHLFRDFLRAKVKQERPQEVKPILARLGQAYEDLGEWEKAHYVYQQLGDLQTLAEMIERSGTFMLQHAMITLETWLNDLPPSMIRARPGLLSIHGVLVYMKGSVRDGLALLNQAEQAFRQQQNNASGLALTLTRRATAYRFLGDYASSIRDAEEVIKLAEESDTLQILYAEALRVKGLALNRLGQTRQAVELLERSLTLYIHLNETSSIPILQMETGMLYQAIGDYPEAGAAYEKAIQIWRKEGNLSWLANSLNNLGVLRQFQGDYEKAALAFEEGLVFAQKSNYTRMEALIAIGLGDLYAELEDFSVAQGNYQHAEEIVQVLDDRYLLVYLIMAQVSLALLQKNEKEARKLIANATIMLQLGDSRYEKGLFKLGLGRLSLLEGDLSSALRLLEEAEHCFLEDGRKLECDTSRIWLIAAYYQVENLVLARQMVKTTLSGRGPVAHAILVSIHQARHWLEGLQKDVEVGRLMGDIMTRAGRLVGKAPATRRQLHRIAHVVQIPNPHLIIEALGQVSVKVGGKPLLLSDWQTQSVRDLFFYFLTSQKPLTKEQIGNALWPEIYEPARLKLRFKNEIYRLRRAVGQETILFEDVFYSFNRDLDYEYDVEAFEAFLAGARASDNINQKITLYQKAVDLVRGPYMVDLDVDWVLPERERLNQVYLSALLSLADLYLRESHPEKSLELCQRAIEYEPTHEAAYRLSMQIFSRMGNKGAILRTYQACQNAMQRQLDMPPSSETEELYRVLTS